MPRREPSASAQIDDPERRPEIIGVVRQLVAELRGRRAGTVDVSPRSRLDRDLGIDSLGRTELILRIERALRVRLPSSAVAEVETIGDLLAAIENLPQRRTSALPAMPAPASLPPVSAPVEALTLTEMLDWHVARHPGRLHVTLLEDESTIVGTMTYAQLAQAARGVAAGLVAREVAPGDRVSLMLPTSLDFFVAFFGVLYAGAIPVPIYPPARPSQLGEHMQRQAGILRNAGAALLLTVPEAIRLGSRREHKKR